MIKQTVSILAKRLVIFCLACCLFAIALYLMFSGFHKPTDKEPNCVVACQEFGYATGTPLKEKDYQKGTLLCKCATVAEVGGVEVKDAHILIKGQGEEYGETPDYPTE